MGKYNDLVIPFSGMKEGDYSFDFSLNDSFFESLEFSQFGKGDINVHVEMERRQHMLNLDIQIKGRVLMQCDRCGNDYYQPIETQRNMVVNLEAEEFEDEDDLISLPAHYTDLDLTQYVYEYIALAVPARLVCPEDPGCDPEVIAKLEKLQSGNEENPSEETDPRWDALKNLKHNN